MNVLMNPWFWVSWYLIGSFGGLFIAYIMVKKITKTDVFIFCTVGGICGYGTFVSGLIYLLLFWLDSIFDF
jgi:hypothetical protein